MRTGSNSSIMIDEARRALRRLPDMAAVWSGVRVRVRVRVKVKVRVRVRVRVVEEPWPMPGRA